MRRIIYLLLVFTLVIAISNSCEKEIHDFTQDIQLNLPETPFDYVPDSWAYSNNSGEAMMKNLMESTGISDAGATLGRVLFYDPQLSLNNRVSCASCHNQKNAFADPGRFSVGFENATTPRNSMAIINPILNNSLFWDSRVSSVEELVSEPIQNHIEMGMESMDKLVHKLNTIDYYKPLAKEAFGSESLDETQIVSALSQFLRSMVSVNSKFDVVDKTSLAGFTPQEQRGHDIFFSADAQCSTCHSGLNLSAPDGGFGNKVNINLVNFNGQFNFETIDPADPRFSTDFNQGEYFETQGTANIGLDLIYSDNGFGKGQFKIPTLRNIALTAPYMHDGRYATLEEVVDHYSEKIKLHENLDPKFIENGNAKRLNLSKEDKAALVAFLKTLTDEEFVNAERFSDPFTR